MADPANAIERHPALDVRGVLRDRGAGEGRRPRHCPTTSAPTTFRPARLITASSLDGWAAMRRFPRSSGARQARSRYPTTVALDHSCLAARSEAAPGSSPAGRRPIIGGVEHSNSRLAALWSALTRERPHQGIDLLFGAFLLIGVAAWLASVSPVLAALLVIAVTGGYLISLHGQEKNQKKLAQPPVSTGAHGRDVLNELATALAEAPVIPLTDWVRVDPEIVRPLVEEVRAAAVATPGSGQAEKLAQIVLGDRPLVFTDQVRVDRRRAQKAIAELRSSLQ